MKRANPSGELSPEQQKALQTFQEALNLRDQLTVQELKPEHVALTGSKIFITGKIGRGTLPHQEFWVWNQSKAQKVLEDNDQYSTVLKKLNPRKKLKDQQESFPSYKLWVITTKYKNKSESENRNFIWCEKGETIVTEHVIIPAMQAQPIESIDNTELVIQVVPIANVDELSFLSAFMDPQDAEAIFGVKPENL